MSDDKIYQVATDWSKRAWIDEAKYKEIYAASLKDPDKFWGEQAKRLTWSKPFTKVKDTSYAPGNISF
jgi:acetyl-CoA synthetase